MTAKIVVLVCFGTIGALFMHAAGQAQHRIERDAQCRQDGQFDVTSIQLNIEFACYCETDSECEAAQ
jgi:hypothetical protein